MKKMMMLLLVLCLLPAAAVAEELIESGQIEFIMPPVIQDGRTIYYVKGDLELDRVEYQDFEQICYRPVTYIKHYSNGETKTTMQPVAMLKITYQFCYGINKNEQYVMAGGNPVPTLTPIAPEHFAVSAVHAADTNCNPVPLADHAGYTYNFSGGYFTMDYYDVIHLDENDNIIRKELKLGQQIAYRCTFTYPEQ